MHGVEIWYHPNDNSYWRFAGGLRCKIVAAAGFTVSDIIGAMITSGAIDRRPGAPGQVVGAQALKAFEGMTVCGLTI